MNFSDDENGRDRKRERERDKRDKGGDKENVSSRDNFAKKIFHSKIVFPLRFFRESVHLKNILFVVRTFFIRTTTKTGMAGMMRMTMLMTTMWRTTTGAVRWLLYCL